MSSDICGAADRVNNSRAVSSKGSRMSKRSGKSTGKASTVGSKAMTTRDDGSVDSGRSKAVDSVRDPKMTVLKLVR